MKDVYQCPNMTFIGNATMIHEDANCVGVRRDLPNCEKSV